MTDIKQYNYLWDGTDPEWVLLRDVSDDRAFYSIYNKKTGTALIIEDDDLFAAVIAKMLAAAVPILDGLPPNSR